MFDLVLQFAVELLRALLVDELSGRVRSRLAHLIRGLDVRQSPAVTAHRRNRERFLNRIITEIRQDL